ncbi:MAG: 4-(cytidine 5'-diphospho)-2-C-methyl-D-erythritol kinase [Pseudopedobacter saltans]|uniref:4-diphosphocytidyl-2-C-methyl-D-erythritol kinase n=1 Tax=Pseudopedobacter saltans TaxID=151895 RepID=A0A2W5EIK6_9SPHI|nr:MAG: 4-(cytidine 5'-diphospho)-2-C-methyl-D-erythritol kinase [Pseudopedobacter saltans]
MVVFPNCKINLGLHIRRKRTDGYHDLETIFYPVQQKDILEVIPSSQFSFRQEGIAVEGEANDNLCVKAFHLLKKDFPDLPNVEMFLYKTIPTGAGLGGGSADGAFALQLLNDKFHLGLTQDQLCQYALILGSDCPFFIWNKPVFAESRGEKMQEVNIDLTGFYILMVNPGIHVSTGAAFQALNLHDIDSHFQKIVSIPVEDWKDHLYNDFEKVVFPQYPEIENLKRLLYDNGAIYASMSGTGSTCFGIFKERPDLDFLPNQYFKAQFSL